MLVAGCWNGMLPNQMAGAEAGSAAKVLTIGPRDYWCATLQHAVQQATITNDTKGVVGATKCGCQARPVQSQQQHIVGIRRASLLMAAQPSEPSNEVPACWNACAAV